jgi:8-oxo-dGTP diphosphatase
MPDRFRIPAVVLLILKQQSKVLLMRRYNTSWLNGYYDLVGGHLDGKETLTAALCREAKEEVGIAIKPEDAELVHVLHLADDTEYLYTFFAVDKWQGEPSIKEPDKCDELGWFSLDNLPENIAPATKTVLAKLSSSSLLTEFTPIKE